MSEAFISLGSNLGDRAANFRRALDRMDAAGVTVKAWSSVWETEPVPPNQPRFLNAVVRAETLLAPEQLLDLLKRIETELGRQPGRRWGPRPIDLDILIFDDLVLEGGVLTIPHPRMSERGFVLAPLAEVLDGPLPTLGRSAKELLAEAGTAGLTRTAIRLR
jgi:2-amino-4-hydroxy-6-hydroxymethyldihydropteridine diphosphokinase